MVVFVWLTAKRCLWCGWAANDPDKETPLPPSSVAVVLEGCWPLGKDGFEFGFRYTFSIRAVPAAEGLDASSARGHVELQIGLL